MTIAIPGAARELPVRVGHVRRARLVPADHVAQVGVVQRVEHGQVALPGDAEEEVGAVNPELVDQDLPAAAAHRPPFQGMYGSRRGPTLVRIA